MEGDLVFLQLSIKQAARTIHAAMVQHSEDIKKAIDTAVENAVKDENLWAEIQRQINDVVKETIKEKVAKVIKWDSSIAKHIEYEVGEIVKKTIIGQKIPPEVL